MKIVNIIGGLGNQMFQYAFAIALQEKFRDEKVLIDTTHFNYLFIKKLGAANLHNGFEIEKIFPKANLKHATARDLMKITWYMPNYVLSRVIRRIFPIRKNEYIQNSTGIFAYNDDIFNVKGNGYFEGVWQSIRYFEAVRDKLQAIFSHPEPNDYNRKMIRNILDDNSVGIHVRRGDYLSLPAFCGICGVEYYKKGIDEVLKDGKEYTFYIFSNDMKWCENHIAPLVGSNKIEYVSGNIGENSCWDMFLMTYCKDLIIANSSFSWWGAFLSKSVNRVIAPYPWLNRDCIMENYMDGWIKIKSN